MAAKKANAEGAPVATAAPLVEQTDPSPAAANVAKGATNPDRPSNGKPMPGAGAKQPAAKAAPGAPASQMKGKGKNGRAGKKSGAKSKAAKPEKPAAADDENEKKRVSRPHPVKTLEDALTLPLKIKDKIEKPTQPVPTEVVADLCGYKNVRSGNFFYLANAARDYDLTKGTWSTDTIEISDLGRKIVYATDPASEREAKIEAFFKVDIFKKMFGHYGGSILPALDDKYLRNKLENDLGLHRDLHEEFIKLYVANCKYVGIEKGLTDLDRRSTRFTRDTPEGADVRVVGEAKGKFDRTAFVIMPFTEKGQNPRPLKFFDEVLNSLITPAANQAGFAVETAQRHGSEVIQHTIINQLLQADLVICDLTDHNPNVLLELGIRLAKELPVALIRATGTGPIFDVDHMLRVESYSPNLWTTSIENDLPNLAQHFKATWDNRSVNPTYMTILTAKHPAAAGAAATLAAVR